MEFYWSFFYTNASDLKVTKVELEIPWFYPIKIVSENIKTLLKEICYIAFFVMSEVMHYCITSLMAFFVKVFITVLIRWFILQNRTNFLDQFSEELHYPRTSEEMDEVFCLFLFYKISLWGELELSSILIQGISSQTDISNLALLRI